MRGADSLRGGTDSNGRICGHKEEITITIVIQLALYCFLLWLIAIGMLWVGHSKFWMIPKMEKGGQHNALNHTR